MSAEAKTVQHMRLRGAARSSMLRVVPEIEDALATVSWPHANGALRGSGSGTVARRHASVLQIRHLALPRLSSGISRFAIARLIEAQIAKGAVAFATASALPADQNWIVWQDRVEMLVAAAVHAARAPQDPKWWQALGLPAAARPCTPEGFARAVLHFCEPGGPDLVAAALIRLLEVMPEVHLRRWLPETLRVWQKACPVPELHTHAYSREGSESAHAPDFARRLGPFMALPKAVRARIWMLGNRTPKQLHAKLETLLRSAAIGPEAEFWIISQVAAAQYAPAAQPQINTEIAKIWRDAADRFPAQFQSHGDDVAQETVVNQEPPMAVTPTTATEVDAVFEPSDTARQHIAVAPNMASPPEAQMTRLGGCVSFINMISHLGMAKADAEAGSDFALRVLHGIIARSGANDPLSGMMPEPAPGGVTWQTAENRPVFVPKLTWFASKRPFILRRLTGIPGRAALCLPHGGTCLAVLDAKALAGLRADHKIRRGAALEISAQALTARLCTGLMLLVCCSLRRVADLSWRAALLRPGYVIGSLTHLDVTLDLEDIRLAERRAGLDVSPGWVVWLGRVVTLHYERFEKPRGARDE